MSVATIARKADVDTMQDANRSCRFCSAALTRSFADLGMSPLANSYVPAEKASSMEPFFPLQAYVCTSCWLVQLEAYENSENIFGDYAYFSSFSSSWLEHAKRYTQTMRERFKLDRESLAVEIASNDGYLLQYFLEEGVQVLGVEPAANVAKTAIEKGIPTEVRFFGEKTAATLVEAGIRPDLLLGNNVLAHVPDLNDFVAGMKLLLKPGGVITMEFPHLQQLVEHCQFDTIYHEHFSYFSFCSVERVFAHHGLSLFDVDEIPTHGGSLRIYACHTEDDRHRVTEQVLCLRRREQGLGYEDTRLYDQFAETVRETKRALLEFLIDVKRDGKSVVAYGAPAKGNTLLNYCGVGPDFIDYTVDLSPHKQDHLLPGTRIPIHAPDVIRSTRPDYILILPWNLKDEIMQQMSDVTSWGGRFVVPIPRVQVL
ncbi:MAG: class I SAM-dependent methyltransferase [Pseudomonadales bacterium]|jgi:SAM-dependent methyltransferase|nr:class I SAM-dependent methyltransferase [Pseudomonadales bacterium]MDP6473010.1 class I SAM-dependent methyltransferase [Pseudomonadales bacterium]MDP6826233.1 class I SAM-dependent methyltransferase [Pseudomonadales bacterium]|tara:strand:+ start:280 stop:1560 length:1281 start_codon:yes stop_codon:yes gene_type:complete